MAVRWTADQQKVIDARGASLLVSAAAGSGKTAVLVERIIRRIMNPDSPMDIDRMLVMTFTRAAAAEIRDRIGAAIEQKLQALHDDPDADEAMTAHLEQQAVMVQSAKITTIDSFCQWILREHFDQLQLDPSFRVADEGEMLLMRADVMKELLEEAYREGGEKFAAFADMYGRGKTDEALGALIERVWSFSESHPEPDEWIMQCRREIAEQGTESAGQQPAWMKVLMAELRERLKCWIDTLGYARDICLEPGGPRGYLNSVQNDLDQLETAAGAEDFSAMSTAFNALEWKMIGRISKKDQVNPDLQEKVKSLRDQVKNSVKAIRGDYFYDLPENMAAEQTAGKEQLLILLDMTERFRQKFLEKKAEKNCVDFGDLEHMALQVLSREAVAAEISAQFDEILVDEYQDSNLVQERLIQYVSGGRPNVVMVGDVKQSIYKFRLARPELFLEKYHSYREDDDHRLLELHQNFRSRPEVLEAVNLIFREIMMREFGGIEYDASAMLMPGAEFAPIPGEQLSDHLHQSELLLTDTAQLPERGEEDPELAEALAQITAREWEAKMVADRIRELTDPHTGMPVWDPALGAYRRAEYRDIVILLRSQEGWTSVFREVLEQNGIPAWSENQTGYFDTQEVQTVLDFMALLDNPVQDIPLAAVLHSPIVGLSDRDMAEIEAGRRREPQEPTGQGMGFYGAVVQFCRKEWQPGSHEREIRDKLLLLKRRLDMFREESAWMPADALLRHIYDETGYALYVTAMPGGEARKANLDMLTRKAAEFAQSSYRGVFHFIRYIRKLKTYNMDFGQAQGGTEQGNVVRMMSIHKSKGLEFPIVFVSGLAKRFNQRDFTGQVLVDADLGIGTEYVDEKNRIKGPTLKKNVMKHYGAAEQLGEELRVLYVALTRAKEKLILTAGCRNPQDRLARWKNLLNEEGRVSPEALESAGSMLDWIMMGIGAAGAQGRSPEKIWRTVCLAPSVQMEEEKQRLGSRLDQSVRGTHIDLTAVQDPELAAQLDRVRDFHYRWEKDTRLNTKVSVSEIKKRRLAEIEPEEQSAPLRPAFGKERTWISGTVRGTAVHRFMERLPLGRAAESEDLPMLLRQTKAKLREEGILSEKEAESVDLRMVERFVRSDLGQRAARADRVGKLCRERQFVVGLPARKLGWEDSDEPVLLQGIIDAYFHEDGQLVLFDYKTDRVSSEEELRRRYGIQLECYRLALEQISGQKVSAAYIYSFSLGEILL